MDTSLASLDARFRPLAVMLLAKLVEARIPVVIVNTKRTQAEHDIQVIQGKSWVQHSKHQDGLAIDICPYSVYQEYGDDKLQWSEEDPIWNKIGPIGEDLGLRWGGRWKKRDMGHFELVLPV